MSDLDDEMNGAAGNNPNGPQPAANGHTQQGQPSLSTDVLIVQLLQQLQQQQQATNLLIQQQQRAQEQQNARFQLQNEAINNMRTPSSSAGLLDSLASNVKEFRYQLDENITFTVWFSLYEELFSKDAAELDDSAKVRLLMRKLGVSEHERYTSFILPQTAKDFTFEQTVSKLKNLFGAPESILSRRYRCLQESKGPTEDYVSYACRINRSCVEFELSRISEEEFKCLIFIFGLKSEVDAEIRTRLLTRMEETSGITLEKLSAECQRLINLRHDTEMIEGSSVNAIRGQQFQAPSEIKQFQTSDKAALSVPDKRMPSGPCWNCGQMHFNRDCPFKSHRCSECNRFGHREGFCSSSRRSSRSRRQQRKNVNNFEVDMRTVSVALCTVKNKRKYVSAELNGTKVKLQFDTASDITVVSSETWGKIGKPSTKTASVKAKSASGDTLALLSEFECLVKISGISQICTVFVVSQDLNILGLDLIEKFCLDSVPMVNFCYQISEKVDPITIRLKRKYPKVFSTDLGKCTKTVVKLDLKPDRRPVFRPKRPVAYSMYLAVDEELDRLEHLGIITPTDYSEWAAPIVVVRKANGNIRLCGDYSTGLNEALQPNQYPLPLPNDIFNKLGNCRVFSIVDMSESYLQIPVDEATSKLLSINTHRGIYQVNRLAPGVKAAPGIFQQIVDTLLAGLSRTCGYLDDLIVGGETEEEHWNNLQALFERLEEFGFTVRLEKCSFGRQQIKYLGHLLDHHGIRPDPGKVAAIKLMPPPNNVSEVRSFLGAIHFYGKFVANMRDLRYPLDELLKTGAKFVWSPECQASFVKFKEILSSDLLLTHYNPQLEIIVSADASSVGLGATISHRFPDGTVKVVQHASRALAPAERNYSQIDREGLAIIFAVTKFHRMVFGRKFRLQTDHAPLLRVFGSKTGIPVYTANRLQRWALTLLLYDFTIEYVSTAKFGQADILSRLINQHAKPSEDYVIAAVTLEIDVKSVTTNTLNAFPITFSSVESASLKDPVMKQVYRYVQNGWPLKLALNRDDELQRFFDRRDSLTTINGCVLSGERLVIPATLRKQCLEQLHLGHPGIVRMKAIARSYVYWPSLDKEIVRYVSSCPHCAMASKSPAIAPPILWPKTTRPWQRVHIDFAGPISDEYYLLVIDSHSKWPEIVPTSRITSTATINLLRNIFARLGNPETIISDNGLQFTSAEFDQFCATNGISHIRTAPFHPQSNGQAERFVDTFKRAIKKITSERGTIKEALDVFLLTYCSTPNRSNPDCLSPSEVMFGRKIRTSLELLRPPNPKLPSSDAKVRSFEHGQSVYAKVFRNNKWNWARGNILQKVGQAMYNVTIEGGRVVSSHVNQLRERHEGTSLLNGFEQPKSTKPLPVDILLDAWNLPASSETESEEAVANPTTLRELVKLPSLSPADSESSSPTMESSMSDAEHSSPHFESASASTPSAVPPRRSTRNRKPPQRFQAYLRY
ncbi:uncharacterized protein K02A2.6-like [Uranotaenia lowii]|uniref:uncharacterized protein K02A2.6-like n=1 Tax=Uranotaenia lowii TaxID=190385 RepID=UPI00247A8A99|nr:uncharacterized protein K02A2.6-like [Uranotaenia lowii]